MEPTVMDIVITNAASLISLAGALLSGLITLFPINIIVAGMIGGIAFKWVRGAKKVAR